MLFISKRQSSHIRRLVFTLLVFVWGSVFAQPVAPITILINQSPWLGGFEALVDRYMAETGNRVDLIIVPFSGMLTRSLTAVTAAESEFDIINLNEQWYSQFYAADLVTPINEIDPDFELDPEVIEYAFATRWNREVGYSTADGQLYGLPINGNIQLFFYREDLFAEHGLQAPVTWDDVEAAAQKLHNPPGMVGLAIRTGPPNWELQAYLHAAGGGLIELDETTSEWEVIIHSDASLEGFRKWLDLNKTYGPANYANLGQAEVVSLMQSGRIAMAHMVGAAAPQLEDPDQSVVVGKVAATVVPGPTAEQRATMSGIWVMGIPRNIPFERKQAALEFLRYALTHDAQLYYARSGAIPVRQDVYEELGQEEGFRWMRAMAESTPYIRPQPRIAEAPQLIEILDRHASVALLGQVPAEQALRAAAQEIYDVLVAGGYNVKSLE